MKVGSFHKNLAVPNTLDQQISRLALQYCIHVVRKVTLWHFAFEGPACSSSLTAPARRGGGTALQQQIPNLPPSSPSSPLPLLPYFPSTQSCLCLLPPTQKFWTRWRGAFIKVGSTTLNVGPICVKFLLLHNLPHTHLIPY